MDAESPIPTRSLGTTGLQVSSLGMGCMGMSAVYGSIDSSEAGATLQAAVDAGVTLFDTADVYGAPPSSGAERALHGEELVGRALADRRTQVHISTKFGYTLGPDGKIGGIDGRPEYVRSACDASLSRLGTDYIDLYFQHRPDPTVPIEDTVGAMSELVAAGKVRYLGLSAPSVDTLRRGFATAPISAVQTEYSIWTRDAEAGLDRVCRELGIGVIAYTPLGRGFLTGEVLRADALSDDDVRRALPRFQQEAIDANMRLLDEIKAVASAHGATPAQIALAWLLARGPHVVPIPGMERREYLHQNLAAVHITLTSEEVSRLGSLTVVGDPYPDMQSVQTDTVQRSATA